MDKRVIYLLPAVALLSLSSCNKKLSQFSSDFFTTTPTPIESVGNEVPAKVTGHIPSKFMVKNARVTATPVLKWSEGEVKGEPSIIQGEEVRANGQVVSYKEGGTVLIPFKAPYQSGMEQSDLWLEFEVDQNGKLYVLPQVKVGNGVISTSTLASAKTVTPALAPDNFQKVITEQYSANIHFLINQANVRSSELKSDQYSDLNKQLQEASKAKDREIAGVKVNSYASPEGSYKFNEQLAQKREKNTTSVIESQMKKDKITEFGELTSSFTPEDWDGFKELVEKSNIQDKELIISVLNMYNDPEDREREIRNLSSVFNELADQILPQLRYSRIIATINVIGKTDQELVDIYSSEPSKLTADEMLYMATLTNDDMRKMDIYRTVTETYPNEYRGYNDLGMVQYKRGDYSSARANFNKAHELNPQAKEPTMNLGLISMLEGNMQKANELLGSSAGIPEAGDALGVYYLNNGDLSKALTSFGSAKTNNAALAQILAKDYSSARNTLSSIAEPDATTYYLAAILGARTGSENMVITNLRQAVRLDNNMLNRAKKDLEFANYNLSAL